MTELETRLAAALEQLGKQYEADVRSLSRQVQDLTGQVSGLAQQVQALSTLLERQSRDASSADKKLREDLASVLSKHSKAQSERLDALGKMLNELAES